MPDLILDTDIGSDIDDALALAYAIRHPEINLRAVTTVADDVEKRAHVAKVLLEAAGAGDVEVAAGIGWEHSPSGRVSSWPHDFHGLLDHEVATPSSSRDAVMLLLEERDAAIATIGMPTNVAAAVKRDATFPSRVPLLVVMGGVFGPIVIGDHVLPPSIDHNLCVDPESSLVALGAGMPMLITPIDITVQARMLTKHLDALRGGDDFCRLLAWAIEQWMPTSGMREGTVALMHDPLTVSVLVERRFVETKRLPVTVAAMRSGHVRTFVDPLEGTEAEVVTSIDGDAFVDHWLEVVLG